jgi:16S rRNA processing protein RimM
MAQNCRDTILVGRVCGVFGLAGWIKVFSYTEPRENIVRYTPWHLLFEGCERVMKVADGRRQGNGVVAKLAGVEDRESAGELVGTDIAVLPAQFEPLPAQEYYWTQLVGLEVVNTEGCVLGTVDHLLRTGANDVMVLTGKRERLIPFVRGQIVQDINLDVGVIKVDWAHEF